MTYSENSKRKKNKCTELLEIAASKRKISDEVKTIVEYSVNGTNSSISLGVLLEKIAYEEALDCRELFFIFLRHSENNLLIRMMENTDLGRSSKELGRKAFFAIW